MNLPFEVVPGSRTLKFRWRQTVTTPFGLRTIEHEGSLPPTCEDAIKLLLDIAKQLQVENTELRRAIEEKTTKAPTPTPSVAQTATARKGPASARGV